MTDERMAPVGMSTVRMTTPRLYAFAVTGALHIVLIVALLAALKIIDVVRPLPPINVVPWIEEAAVARPPLQPPEVARPDVPDIKIAAPNFDVARSEGAITIPVVHPIGPKPVERVTVASVPVLVAPRVSGRVGPPAYPSVARRLEEQGSVVLGFIVGTDGRVLPDSIEVLNGSGFERLDDAARQAIARIRFVAGTRAGVAVPMRHSFKITYSLNER